jgi:16S rRNA (cytosine967-C5)-methyltransferase
VFGDERAEEGAALASRAPLDLRANALKATRDEAARSIADLAPEPTRWSPHGLRIKLRADAKNPAVHAEFAYLKGLIEIQDEGSQLAALLAGAKPGEQVLDLCAGGGGKTLALAALMENKGQIYATDDDKRRLAPIHDRLDRSGARNVQVRAPKSVGNELADLAGKLDLVLIDAPCTGIGAWRRNPDAKWRIRPGALEVRIKEQSETLEPGRPVAPAGRSHRLHHLLGAGRGKRRANPELHRLASGFFRSEARRSGECPRRARVYVQQGGAQFGRRLADDAAPDRHRRLLHLDSPPRLNGAAAPGRILP